MKRNERYVQTVDSCLVSSSFSSCSRSLLFIVMVFSYQMLFYRPFLDLTPFTFKHLISVLEEILLLYNYVYDFLIRAHISKGIQELVHEHEWFSFFLFLFFFGQVLNSLKRSFYLMFTHLSCTSVSFLIGEHSKGQESYS